MKKKTAKKPSPIRRDLGLIQDAATAAGAIVSVNAVQDIRGGEVHYSCTVVSRDGRGWVGHGETPDAAACAVLAAFLEGKPRDEFTDDPMSDAGLL